MLLYCPTFFQIVLWTFLSIKVGNERKSNRNGIIIDVIAVVVYNAIRTGTLDRNNVQGGFSEKDTTLANFYRGHNDSDSPGSHRM